MELLWIGIGGAIGAVGRYLVGRELTERIAGVFPYGTFTVNIVGAFLIGVLFVVLSERSIGDDYVRLLLVTGFLGGFTTFSSYTLEAINLAEGGDWGTALVYVLSSNILGLLACLAGIVAVRGVT
ncbi:MAG TPA: fluoride efflux transporter CrcB [Thermomicrobiales bacterium]|nr:fluoride efflux transporter CrcB [Thermomicrobiales bacterium]